MEAKIKEIWKDVVGYEGLYKCSNLGRVKSLFRIVKRPPSFQTINGKILMPVDHTAGYVTVKLRKNASGKSEFIHRLVATAFIKNPEGKPTVNHKNGIKNDNRVSNLEWCTFGENNQHAYSVLNRRSRKGIKNGEGLINCRNK